MEKNTEARNSPGKYGQMIFDRAVRSIQWGKIVFQQIVLG
jgi:hypothetical protein